MAKSNDVPYLIHEMQTNSCWEKMKYNMALSLWQNLMMCPICKNQVMHLLWTYFETHTRNQTKTWNFKKNAIFHLFQFVFSKICLTSF